MPAFLTMPSVLFTIVIVGVAIALLLYAIARPGEFLMSLLANAAFLGTFFLVFALLRAIGFDTFLGHVFSFLGEPFRRLLFALVVLTVTISSLVGVGFLIVPQPGYSCEFCILTLKRTKTFRLAFESASGLQKQGVAIDLGGDVIRSKQPIPGSIVSWADKVPKTVDFDLPSGVREVGVKHVWAVNPQAIEPARIETIMYREKIKNGWRFTCNTYKLTPTSEPGYWRMDGMDDIEKKHLVFRIEYVA
jgi:hypothetical protein